jgi:LysM repeat protein
MIKLLFFIGYALFNPVLNTDSVGLETINGKTFIIHKVEEKETLFAISRRYGATVDAITSNNTIAAGGLEIGQLLRIPYVPKTPAAKGSITHTVAQKETLFSIARLYGVTTDDIKKWNSLPDNSLSIGQQLSIRKATTSTTTARDVTPAVKNSSGIHVVAEKETLYSIARMYKVFVADLRRWNNLPSDDVKIGQTIIVSGTATPTNRPNPKSTTTSTSASTPTATAEKTNPVVTSKNPVSTASEKVGTESQTIKISESVRNGDEILETGVAELIAGTEGNRKYLALHRTAPVGTILKVKNEMNNREVFVRVMGKLPDTNLTDKVIIRISKSAYDRLGAIDQRFRVEVTYYK